MTLVAQADELGLILDDLAKKARIVLTKWYPQQQGDSVFQG